MKKLQLLRLDLWIAKLFDRVADNPIGAALIAIASALLIGGGLFSLVEPDTSFIDGVWWAFVSMTTVGYGDIAPKTTIIRFIATGVILTGIFATAIMTAALAGRVAQVRIQAANDTPQLDDDMDHCIAQLEALRDKLAKDYESDCRVVDAAEKVIHAYDSNWLHGDHIRHLKETIEHGRSQ
jgi:voltage-gated potassium channel